MKPKVSEPHPTISGWCCACDVDQMTYRGMLKKALDQQKAEIVEILTANKFKRIDNDATWYLNYDDIIKRLEER